MRPYRDAFGNPITKQDVMQAVAIVVRTGNPWPSNLHRKLKIGYAKAARLVKVLSDAGVTSEPDVSPQVVILRDEAQATNAALRQLKKGKK